MESEEQPPTNEWGSVRPGSLRPKWLSVMTISAIVMGCLFGCCGIAGIGGMALGQVMNPAAMPVPQGDERAAQFRKRYVERTAAFQAKIFPMSLGSGLLAFVHAAALAIAGVIAYRVRPVGRRLLATLCLLGIAVEVVSGYIGLYVTTEQNAVMAPLFDELMKSGAERGQQTEEQKRALGSMRSMMSTAFKAGSVLGWLTVIGLFLVKSAYYLACALYLRRPEVIAYFEPRLEPAPSALPDQR